MARPTRKQKIYHSKYLKTVKPFSKQNLRKSEQTLEINFTKSREIFSFKPPISVEGCWII